MIFDFLIVFIVGIAVGSLVVCCTWKVTYFFIRLADERERRINIQREKDKEYNLRVLHKYPLTHREIMMKEYPRNDRTNRGPGCESAQAAVSDFNPVDFTPSNDSPSNTDSGGGGESGGGGSTDSFDSASND